MKKIISIFLFSVFLLLGGHSKGNNAVHVSAEGKLTIRHFSNPFPEIENHIAGTDINSLHSYKRNNSCGNAFSFIENFGSATFIKISSLQFLPLRLFLKDHLTFNYPSHNFW